MTLAEDICKKIEEGGISATAVLRMTLKLAKSIQDKQFDWLEFELNGYPNGILDKNALDHRTTEAIESRYITGITQLVRTANSKYLDNTQWISYILHQPVPELEDLLASGGYNIKTGNVLKIISNLPVEQIINIPPHKIKTILDKIQNKIYIQLTELISKKPRHPHFWGTIFIYKDKFPEAEDDLEKIRLFIENGNDPTAAVRACRSVMFSVIRNLIILKKPIGYIFSDGKALKEWGERSKMKYYLEIKGEEIHKSKFRILELDISFKEIYTISARAEKGKGISIQEANFCIDLMIEFLDKLYRYTDLAALT